MLGCEKTALISNGQTHHEENEDDNWNMGYGLSHRIYTWKCGVGGYQIVQSPMLDFCLSSIRFFII